MAPPACAEAIGQAEESEAEILFEFWELYRQRSDARLVGFNCVGFDIPFLVRRSWFHGIAVPESLFERGGRYLSPRIVDLMLLWGIGNREYVKLNTLAIFLGIGGKPEGVSGADFGALWTSGNAESRGIAMDYLRNDLDMTWKLAERMGVIQ